MEKTKMLKKNYEFRRVLSKGKHYSGKNIDAVIKKENKNCIFLGLAINTKAGKAVKRNRVKRLIRENYKNIERNVKEGVTIVFLWKKNADIEKVTYDNIKKDMFTIFDKAKILKEDE